MLTDFMAAYNFARRLNTLSGLTPYGSAGLLEQWGPGLTYERMRSERGSYIGTTLASASQSLPAISME